VSDPSLFPNVEEQRLLWIAKKSHYGLAVLVSVIVSYRFFPRVAFLL